MIVWGQSNPLFMGRDWFSGYNFGLASNDLITVGGAGIDYFVSGSSGFNEIKRIVIAQSIVWPLAPIWIAEAQGETDAQNLTLANAWGGKMFTMANALEAQTGRSDLFYISTYLPADMTAPTYDYGAQVNTSKDTFTRPGNRKQMINLDLLPGANGGDHLHWDNTRKASWQTQMASIVTSVA